jgi:hypothetical protein
VAERPESIMAAIVRRSEGELLGKGGGAWLECRPRESDSEYPRLSQVGACRIRFRAGGAVSLPTC